MDTKVALRTATIFIGVFFFLCSLAYADSNGIWFFAEDVRGGTFASDEQNATSDFIFLNPVYLFDDVGISTVSPSVKVYVNGTVHADNIRNVDCGDSSFMRGFDSNGTIVCEGY